MFTNFTKYLLCLFTPGKFEEDSNNSFVEIFSLAHSKTFQNITYICCPDTLQKKTSQTLQCSQAMNIAFVSILFWKLTGLPRVSLSDYLSGLAWIAHGSHAKSTGHRIIAARCSRPRFDFDVNDTFWWTRAPKGSGCSRCFRGWWEPGPSRKAAALLFLFQCEPDVNCTLKEWVLSEGHWVNMFSTSAAPNLTSFNLWNS